MHKIRSHCIEYASATNNTSHDQQGTTGCHDIMNITYDDSSRVRIDSMINHGQKASPTVEYMCNFEQYGYVGKMTNLLGCIKPDVMQ